MRIHSIFHISLLKRYSQNDDDLFSDRIQPAPELITIDNAPEYIVERILDKRTKKAGRGSYTEYLVK